MKLLVDVCIGWDIEKQVKERLKEFDLKFIRDVDARMKDIDILQIAENESRVVITSDKDFGELVYKEKLPHKGVLLLRYEELLPEERIETIVKIISFHRENLENKFSVYQNGKLRIQSK